MKKGVLFILIISLVIVPLTAAFAGCADNGPSSEGTSTDDPTGEQGDDTDPIKIIPDIPEDVDFEKAEVTFLAFKEYTMNEFFSEGIDAHIVGDAIYERNEMVENKLNIKLNYVLESTSQIALKLQNDINSGLGEFDIVADKPKPVPLMALQGLLHDLTSLEYINFEKPWWPATLIEQCSINDRLYFASGDISTNLLWMMVGTFFNINLIDTLDLENPYDLVEQNKWTLDKFIEMATNKYNDNGNNIVDDGDFFGLTMYSINLDAFFNGSGLVAVEKNSTGEPIMSPNLGSQKVFDMLDKLGDFYTTTSDVRRSTATSIRNIFFEERSLFTADRVFIVAGKDNYGSKDRIEFKYGLVPMPKYNDDQLNYSTCVANEFGVYGISIAAFDADICAAAIEYLGYKSREMVTPMVFEEAMKVRYAPDDFVSASFDILRDTICFDLGRFYTDTFGQVYRIMREQVEGNSKSFASQMQSVKTSIERGITVINKRFYD